MTDAELLRAYVRDRSNEAMGELVQRHAGMVREAALRELKDGHLADDVTQAVFVVLMRRAAELSENVVLGGWLFKTTLYCVADLRKQRRRREFHERETTQMAEKQSDTADPGSETMPLLNEGLSQLSAADRDAIVLRFLEGHSPAAVAGLLGISEENARQRVSRAVGRLRRFFGTKGVALGAGALAVSLETARADAAGAALTAQIQALGQGAAPSELVHALAEGAMRMLQKTKVALLGAVAALVVAGVGIALASGALHAPPAGAVGPVVTTKPGTVVTGSSGPVPANPAVQAVASKYGPALTPKGTIIAAFNAGMDGDVEGLISCFNEPTEQDKAPLRDFAKALPALKALLTAVETRFGKEGLTKLNESRFMGGLNPMDITDAQETIDGDHAIVDLGKSGPSGGVPMIKIGKVWKADPVIFQTLNREVVAAEAQASPALQKFAQDILDKKFKSVDEVVAALQGMASQAAKAEPAAPPQKQELP